jgi:phosphohistidine phosphatase
MKRLILMRHAKSSWSVPDQVDFDRPLNKRGQRDAPAIGRWLKEKTYLPDLALVSTAVRTQETWDGLLDEIPDCPADFLRSLYHADAGTMRDALRSAPDDSETVLMLGHQPGIGDFGTRLLAQPPSHPDFTRYPTAAVAIIDFDFGAWNETGWGSGRLADFIFPGLLA